MRLVQGPWIVALLAVAAALLPLLFQRVPMRPLVVPLLGGARHKGLAGKVAVVGGSLEYTGAPYFAAQAALRVGADLAHVFCVAEAATPIKAYSPDLIVHPLLRAGEGDASAAADAVAQWFPALHALVVGPGLGRDETVLRSARELLHRAAATNLSVVIDGDGLWAVREHWELVRALGHRAVLTPNRAEWLRMQTQLSLAPDADGSCASRALNGALVVRKGPRDEISNSTLTVTVTDPASWKRVGGQGDVLAGTMGVFAAWNDGPTMEAAVAACRVVRNAAHRAWLLQHRAMLASDVLSQVGSAMHELHPPEVE